MRPDLARLVASRRLDLDNPRAQLAEQHGAIGAGERPGQVDDGYTGSSGPAGSSIRDMGPVMGFP